MEAAFGEGTANLTLVSVDGRSVEVAVAEFEGAAHRLASRCPIDLPGPETDYWQARAATQSDVPCLGLYH